MPFEYHHLDKWAFANLDLVEEILETKKKAVVLISGASSSGKSYSASYLETLLNKQGHKSIIISLDQYNIGLSGIIPNKVNLNYFDSRITNIKEISKRIKSIIYDVDFEDKYKPEVIVKIRESISDLLDKEDLELFLKGLEEEWAKLNFDEPTVYDMKEAANDVKDLLEDKTVPVKKYSKVVSERVPSSNVINGSDYQVILVEGIYALDQSLIDELKGIDIIKDFIDGNPKSLFLRRIIRDAKLTSAHNVFTISLYFKYIVKSYYQSIYPCRESADVILNNDMTFLEMRSGDLYTTKFELHTSNRKAYEKILESGTKIDEVYQKDTYFSVEGEDKTSQNILRLRSISTDGKTYIPSSLVHKGIPKVRKDDKVIRPINVLLKEGEFSKVWDSEADCLNDFLSAGFRIGPIHYKVKTRIIFEGEELTLRDVKNSGFHIEFAKSPKWDVVKKIKKILKNQ